jgi:molybdopterin synthase sulfur carrier subunit
VRVTVRLFARLKDIAGASELERDVRADATLADVWAELAHDFPAMAPYRGSVSGARNAEYARMDAMVADGDEIAFLPPVSGG